MIIFMWVITGLYILGFSIRTENTNVYDCIIANVITVSKVFIFFITCYFTFKK